MRVTEVAVRFAPATGGVETTVLELARRLVRRGHDVEVVAADVPRGAPARVEGIPVARLPFRLSLGGTHLARGIRRAVVATRPDVVHTHLPTAWWADHAARAAAALRRPLVVSYNNDLVGPGLKGLVAAIYNRGPLQKLLAGAAAIVTPNPRYGELSPFLRRHRARLTAIPWGVDLARFSPAPLPPGPPLRVGFLSVLDPHHDYKGLDDLLVAMRLLRAEGRAVALVVGGGGPSLERWRERARALGLDEAAVRFHGHVPDDLLPGFFHDCHVFALPSRDWRQEGFGLVAVEALACGRPVVTTPVVGMAGALAGSRAATLTPPGDSRALAASLAALAADPGLADRAREARRLAERRFDWEAVADAYEAVFRGAGELSRTTSSNSTS